MTLLTSRRSLLLGAAATSIATVRSEPARATEVVVNEPLPIRDPALYTAYVPTASKTGQFHWYTCEFDAAWAILKTFGIDASLDDQLALIGVDDRIEPWYEETAEGFVVHGFAAGWRAAP